EPNFPHLAFASNVGNRSAFIEHRSVSLLRSFAYVSHMAMEPRLDIIGAALADTSRVRMLCELMDGCAHTGKELASVAGIAPNTASGHLGKLLAAEIITSDKSGRCTYYRVASDEIAEVLEQMSALSPTDHLYRVKGKTIAPELVARTCYNHIAGRLGVLITRGMIQNGWVTVEGASARMTSRGIQALVEMGIIPADTTTPNIKCCLDWSERRQHFSGQLGKALLEVALAKSWVTRPSEGRALRIEVAGCEAFGTHFGITKKALSGQSDPA
ncbi:ArsR/SmtB family transcription factor, partial [Litoreibacter roseus]|uniref:ArsR/SmtB family transcription factor n=1 Tax=Litoreibacter roseus TaxID=2601869 RepID=UPI001A9ACA7C